MVRPSSFRKNEETATNNHYQKDVDHDHAAELAVDEFDAMVEQLETHGVHVMVIEDDPSSDTPDSLFPNNWVSFHSDGRVGLYPMYAPNRRAERREDILHDLEHNHGFSVREVVDFTEFETHGAFLEGTGSVVIDRIHCKAYAALSERTDRIAFEQFCETMNLEGIVFEAFQSVGTERKPIYHTNVMMAIGTGWAAVCLDCMDHPDDQDLVRESLTSDGLTVIELSEDQIQSFAGNMLEVCGTANQALIVMSSRAYHSLESAQIESLSAFGILVHIPLETIETCGGGSARCMMAEVHLPLQIDTQA